MEKRLSTRIDDQRLSKSIASEIGVVGIRGQVSQLLEREELEAIRDRALSTLKLGKQSAEYKKAKKAFDQFFNEICEGLSNHALDS